MCSLHISQWVKKKYLHIPRIFFRGDLACERKLATATCYMLLNTRENDCDENFPLRYISLLLLNLFKGTKRANIFSVGFTRLSERPRVICV